LEPVQYLRSNCATKQARLTSCKLVLSKRSVFFLSRQHFSETREDFRHFIGQVLRDVPDDKEVHMILDNYCTRKKNDE
jgi:hypothetical protein